MQQKNKFHKSLLWGLFAFSLFLIINPGIAKASHFRYGHLTWQKVSGNTARFTLVDAFRRSGYGAPNIGDIITETVGNTSLMFGDGTSTGTLQYKVIAIDIAEDWLIGQALQPGSTTKTTIDHTYSGPTQPNGSPWIAEINTAARNALEQNNPNGVYRVLTYVELNSGNTSPISSLPAIVNMPRAANATFVVPGADPDASSTLSFRLATGTEAGNGSFNQPPGLAIDPVTGVVTWNTLATLPGQLFSCQVIIEDRDVTGALLTQVAVDFLIEITTCSPGNNAPVFIAPTPVCGSTINAVENQPVSFTVAASDNDVDDEVGLNTGGLPSGATFTPGLPATGNPVSSVFNWTPGAGTSGSYVVTISATDDCGAQALCSFEISVTTGGGCNPPDVHAGADRTIDGCVQSTQLDGSSSTAGAVYSWAASNGGHIVSGGDSLSPIVDSAGTYVLTVTANGCSATDTALVTIAVPVSCTTCDNDVIVVDQNVTVDFNTTPPTYTGDADLQPYASYDKTGTVKNLWKVTFNVGAKKLLVKKGATITTTKVDGFAPGIVITGTCDMEVESGGHIVVNSANRNSGDVLVKINGNILVNGEIRNEVSGTLGLPGAITTSSKCGNITVGQSGIVQILGIDAGGNLVSLLACGTDCNYFGSGDITVSGLVKSFAHAHAGDQNLHRPDIRVASFNGSVTINANTVEPLYDEFSYGGGLYDIYGGLLSWVSDNVKPGKIEVQSRLNTTVNGHGTDPTGPVRKSFGAVAAVATASDAPGGVVDVRSLQGNINADNRAFDVSGRNRLATKFARIRLWSKNDISLTRTGANNTFNPVLNASSPSVGDKGGTNQLRAYSGGINIGANVLVSALVPSGAGSVQGVNLLQSCTGVTNAGTVNPADLVPGDNSGSCATTAPAPFFTDCGEAGVQFRIRGVTPQITIAATESTEKLKVYPNPVIGKATIQFYSAVPGNCFINVVDLAGRIIFREKIVATAGVNVHELNVSRIGRGTYTLTLDNGQLKERGKIIVL